MRIFHGLLKEQLFTPTISPIDTFNITRCGSVIWSSYQFNDIALIRQMLRRFFHIMRNKLEKINISFDTLSKGL